MLTHDKIERNLKMNVFDELFGKYFSSENLDTNGRNSKANPTVTNDEQLSNVKTMESNDTEGILSTIVEHFDRIVATLRSSVSDHRRLPYLFDGSFMNTTSTTDGPRQRAFTATTAELTGKLHESNDKDNIVGSYGFVIPRRTRKRASSWGTRYFHAHGSESGNFGNNEEALGLRRSRALKSSVSDQRLLPESFDGSFIKKTSTTDGPRQRAFTATTAELTGKLHESNDKDNIVGSYGFVISRRTRKRAASCGTRHLHARGRESGNYGSNEDPLSLRRSRATHKLDTCTLVESLGSKSTSLSRCSSLLVETKGDNSTIDLPSLNEEESCETYSSGFKHDKPSFIDRVRDNLKF